MKLEVYNIKGQSTGREIDLPVELFGVEPNEHTVYLAVKQYLANQRQGTHKSKERWEISRTTKKAFRQKGTGGARRGDMKSPSVRGGGRVFGPRPRDYSFKLNKKVKSLARASALSSKYSKGQIKVVENFTFETPRTKEYLQFLKSFDLENKKSLLVTENNDTKVYLSSRNIQKSNVMEAKFLHTYAIMNSGTLLISEGAVNILKELTA